jgi:hypothetical protein
MADVTGEIEDEVLPSDDFPHEVEVAAVSLDDLNIALDRFDIEVICTASRMEGIEESNGSARLHKSNGEVASDETQAAGN